MSRQLFPVIAGLAVVLASGTAIVTNLRQGFQGALDGSGQGKAAFNLPPNLPPAPPNLILYHAHLVFDAQAVSYMASNPVPLMLRN